jgi:hypothetical protein
MLHRPLTLPLNTQAQGERQRDGFHLSVSGVPLCLVFLFVFIFNSTVARAEIPSPRAVLGFTPGDDRTIADWKQISNYFAQLDRASDRVQVQTLGETTLKRPFIVAFISSPENIRNLAKLKEIQRKLADPRLVQTDAERERLQRDGKTIVVISCSIHSTEIVASQMSMQLAYELATADDAETRETLQNTVLLLIPSANPDGIDIVANWYRKTFGTSFEGTDPPELYHHYAGHDDNRDWFMMNPEGDETRHAALLEGMVSADRLRHTPAGHGWLALLHPAFLRPAESEYRAPPASSGRTART